MLDCDWSSDVCSSDLCDAMVAACFASEDYKEGRTAFMEKRKPVFRGR
jgi:1,4-dihydroxy-2-naphthoyl-CoA synthase